jgi:hypothetical protein
MLRKNPPAKLAVRLPLADHTFHVGLHEQSERLAGYGLRAGAGSDAHAVRRRAQAARRCELERFARLERERVGRDRDL